MDILRRSLSPETRLGYSCGNISEHTARATTRMKWIMPFSINVDWNGISPVVIGRRLSDQFRVMTVGGVPQESVRSGLRRLKSSEAHCLKIGFRVSVSSNASCSKAHLPRPSNDCLFESLSLSQKYVLWGGGLGLIVPPPLPPFYTTSSPRDERGEGWCCRDIQSYRYEI